MSGPSPTVSVVIPYFNAGRFIEATLRNLADQTFRDFEVVIVDDGSAPDEALHAQDAAARWHGTYVRQDNTGPGGARNRGADTARGAWIAFLDADDRWEPTKLAKQLAAAPDCDMVFCDAETLKEDGTTVGVHRWSAFPSRHDFIGAILRGKVFSFTSSILIRASVFRALGGFDRRLRFLEDHLLLYRAVKTLRWTCLNEVLSYRVVHEDSMSHIFRNLDLEQHVERRMLFLEIVSEFEPGLCRTPLLVHELHRNLRRYVVLRRRMDALRLALRAARLDPTCLKTYRYCGAIAFSILQPERFDRWNPDLARLRGRGAAG